jgi:hypothetical protein
MKGKHHTEESKRKISENMPDNSGERNCNYGKKLSEETRKKMSESRSGEKNVNYGVSLSDETRQKMSDAAKKRIIPKELREKMIWNETGVKKKGIHSSKYIGVYSAKRKGYYRAVIRYNKKSIQIGEYDSEVKAAIAYNKKAIELFGDKAKLNIIENED